MDELKKFKGKKFHFIGIGGISMSALAQFLKRDGFYVQGSDEQFNDEIKKLAKKKIRVFVGHSEDNVLCADVVVYSSAIHEDNVELKYARENGLVILKRAELLGMIASRYKTIIAISGSHGKTTATAMISEIFLKCGLKPTVHIGGKLKSIKSNYKVGNKKFFITENCEYMDNFLFVKPDISVILNIDSDHLDYFKNLEGVKKSFYKYACQTNDGGINLVCDEDINSNSIAILENSATFGFDAKCDIFAKNIIEYKAGYYSFDVIFEKCYLGNIKLNIFGKHNVFNALASIFVALICGIDFCDVKDCIENFDGVERRSDKIGEINGAEVYHDYAHHPAQIKKMVLVAKELAEKRNGKVIVIFEPHTFSRTKFLLEDFAKSFELCNYVLFAPVYSAREDKSAGVDSKELAIQTKKYVQNVAVFDNVTDIIAQVKSIAKTGDEIFVLGAGNIDKLAKRLVK